MSTVETYNIPLPEGYSIVEKLGAGGYGEVWKATAPGGVEKAVKLVYGHCNEGMAEREQKALERVKSVRHPFMLSIERYEIVESRLVIVTELADMSLQDEFVRCQNAGHVGIPRDRLLGYLWDAAEALDFLVERHSLQHLDIKPENLLIVGDHTKVADFGLVKQLASQTLNSMMGGITPLYSAPEVFDDNPSPKSDQYSLAIVYQHMLTDTLPFPGRTPAQLAKQHTLATPNLRPLNEADRQVLEKALAKDPAERFADCREFIKALRNVGISNSATLHQGDSCNYPPIVTAAENDTKPVAELDTAAIEVPLSTTATQVLTPGQTPPQPPIPQPVEQPTAPALPLFPAVDSQVTDVEFPEITLDIESATRPTLFVGVGGVGLRMLSATRKQAQQSQLANDTPLAWLGIDTDRDSLAGRNLPAPDYCVAHEDTLHIPLRRPKQYRDSSQNLLKWVSRRWLYNIPRSLQTRGFRPLGRIAVVDHAAEVLTALQARLVQLASSSEDSEHTSPVRVVIFAGMSGGTGSGTVIDVAQAVRSLCRQASLEVQVQGLLGCTYEAGGADSLAAANMLSLLTELSNVQLQGNKGDDTPQGAPSLFESSSPPFDRVHTVAIPMQGSAATNAQLESVANYLLLQAEGKTEPLFDALYSAPKDTDASFSLRTCECIDLKKLQEELCCSKQQQLLKAILDNWLKESDGETETLAQLFGRHQNSSFARAVLRLYPEIVVEEEIDPQAEVESEPKKEAFKANQKRAADVKRLALAFLELLNEYLPPEDIQPGDDEALVNTVTSNVLPQFVQEIRDEMVAELNLGGRLSELLLTAISEVANADSESCSSLIVKTALDETKNWPLECGYEQRSVLLIPAEKESNGLLAEVRETFPTLSACRSPLSRMLLLREGSSLNPLDLAARLAETFPDVDEAAGRLHARTDIAWRDLRLIDDKARS